MAIRIEERGARIHLYFPYHEALKGWIQNRGGRWTGEAWVLDSRDREWAEKQLRHVFGNAGEPVPRVTIRLTGEPANRVMGTEGFDGFGTSIRDLRRQQRFVSQWIAATFPRPQAGDRVRWVPPKDAPVDAELVKIAESHGAIAEIVLLQRENGREWKIRRKETDGDLFWGEGQMLHFPALEEKQWTIEVRDLAEAMVMGRLQQRLLALCPTFSSERDLEVLERLSVEEQAARRAATQAAEEEAARRGAVLKAARQRLEDVERRYDRTAGRARALAAAERTLAALLGGTESAKLEAQAAIHEAEAEAMSSPPRPSPSLPRPSPSLPAAQAPAPVPEEDERFQLLEPYEGEGEE